MDDINARKIYSICFCGREYVFDVIALYLGYSEHFEHLNKSVATIDKIWAFYGSIKGAWLRLNRKPCFADVVPIRFGISMVILYFLPEVNICFTYPLHYNIFTGEFFYELELKLKKIHNNRQLRSKFMSISQRPQKNKIQYFKNS